MSKKNELWDKGTFFGGNPIHIIFRIHILSYDIIIIIFEKQKMDRCLPVRFVSSLSVCLCLSVSLSVCLSLSVRLSLSVCLSVSLSLSLSIGGIRGQAKQKTNAGMTLLFLFLSAMKLCPFYPVCPESPRLTVISFSIGL